MFFFRTGVVLLVLGSQPAESLNFFFNKVVNSSEAPVVGDFIAELKAESASHCSVRWVHSRELVHFSLLFSEVKIASQLSSSVATTPEIFPRANLFGL